MASAAWSLLVFILAICVLTALRLSKRKLPAGGYQSIKPLSEPEQALYWRLKEAMPECVVLAQVSFSRFLQPRESGRSHRVASFNVIAQKTIDFLLCLPDFTVIAAIELDDATHSLGSDARRDAILHGAGVPIVRVHVRDIPSVEDLRAMFTR